MKGDHAVALRTTVLVAVVLTVIVFGGTIGRMMYAYLFSLPHRSEDIDV